MEKLRFCPVGHARPASRRYCPMCHPPHFDAEPLKLWLIRFSKVHGGIDPLAERMALRTETPVELMTADVKKIVYGKTRRISLWKADRLAVGAGLDPWAVWGDEWAEANPWPDLGVDDSVGV